jgi:hypothetical protein
MSKTALFWTGKKKDRSDNLSSNYCSSSSSIKSEKIAQRAIFQEHLMLHFSTTIDKHLTTPQYGFLADWHHIGLGVALKWPTQAALSCQNLTVHDSHFEPTVEIFLVWIKGQDLFPKETKHPSSTPYR